MKRPISEPLSSEDGPNRRNSAGLAGLPGNPLQVCPGRFDPD